MRFLVLVFLCFLSCGLFAQAPVKAPKQNGKYELKNKRGLIETGMCKDGLKSGTWAYFKNGLLQKEEDFNTAGILQATRIFRYNGTGIVEMFSVASEIYEGEYSKFYSRENPLVKGWYTAGKKDKTWSYFRQLNGNNLWKNDLWENGLLIEMQFFYADGKLFKRSKVNASEDVVGIIYYDEEGNELATIDERQILNNKKEDSLRKISNNIPPPPPPPPGQTGRSVSGDTLHSKQVLTYAEVMPAFPSGIQSFLMHNIHYPVISKETGVMGTVYISFLVNQYGDVTDVHCVKGVSNGKDLEEEAIRVVQMMTPFTPGSMNGQNVIIEMKQPVRFVLQ